MIETALADVQPRKAGWTRADLTRAINAALPDYLGIPDGADVAALLDQLTDEALHCAIPLDARPARRRAPAGGCGWRTAQSAYQAPGAQLYATPEHVRTERDLRRRHHRRRRGGAAAPRWRSGSSTGCATPGLELGVDQAAAVRGVLTSGARVETLVGPAGTGKSFVVGAIARGWTDPQPARRAPAGRVFGLATSQVATDVLTAEGLTARNVARWLATQDRLAAGPGSGRPQPTDDDAGVAAAGRGSGGGRRVRDDRHPRPRRHPPPRRRRRGEAAAGR